MMTLLLTSIACGMVAGLIGFFFGQTRAKSASELLIRNSQSNAAAADARSEEIRQQLGMTKKELNRLSEELRGVEKISIAAETKALESERNLLEQKALLDDAKTALSNTFKALASEVLAGNNASFLTLAQEKFKALKEEASSDLDSRKKAVEALVGPLSETLSIYQKEAKALEEKRIREISSVGEQLRSLALAQGTLQDETTKLVHALKSPTVRGRWGEITLRRTAELSGMSSYCDFGEQESVTTDTGRLRPDMIVKLPAGRYVVVDSKVPLGGFLEALEAKTDEEREVALKKHARHVRQHITALASKEYQSQFSSSLDCVVLFIPNDSFLSAAVEKDPHIIESALSKKVLIVTPTTLIGLLLTFAYGWRQEQIAENAQKISELGQDLSERMGVFVEHLIKVGESMGKAIGSYNAAVASFETRILPSARRFKAIGAGGKKEIKDLQPIDQIPRPLSPLQD
jgi:DNA recombination protein RmuC